MSWLDKLLGTDPQTEAARSKASFEAEVVRRASAIPLERWEPVGGLRAKHAVDSTYYVHGEFDGDVVATTDGGARLELRRKDSLHGAAFQLVVDGQVGASYSVWGGGDGYPETCRGCKSVMDLYHRIKKHWAPAIRQRDDEDRRQKERDAETHRRDLLGRL